MGFAQILPQGSLALIVALDNCRYLVLQLLIPEVLVQDTFAQHSSLVLRIQPTIAEGG